MAAPAPLSLARCSFQFHFVVICIKSIQTLYSWQIKGILSSAPRPCTCWQLFTASAKWVILFDSVGRWAWELKKSGVSRSFSIKLEWGIMTAHFSAAALHSFSTMNNAPLTWILASFINCLTASNSFFSVRKPSGGCRGWMEECTKESSEASLPTSDFNHSRSLLADRIIHGASRSLSIES